MSGGRVTVVGDGVIGLAVGLELARDGWSVEIVGEGVEASASAVAAGMLAPASEALLDGMERPEAAALVLSRDLWEGWAGEFGVGIDRSGAVHSGEGAGRSARQAQAERLGLRAVTVEGGLWLPQDARVGPQAALARLADAARRAGAELRRGRVAVRGARLELDGAELRGEVVAAAGWGSAAFAAAAPELGALRPVKGQLLRLTAPPAAGPVIRTQDAYLVPGVDGWIVGATMEPGLEDLAPDPRALARLRSAAASVRPELATAPGLPAVGVRAEVADGRPLVGRSRTGIWLATGLRRNGWLLAPLVARGVAAYLAGGDADRALGGRAGAWDPARVFTQGWA